MKISIVCGLHRSGTTIVGELLRYADFCVIHEPLNEQFGMVDVPIAYPYVENGGDQFSYLLDDAVTLKRPWNKTTTHLQAKGLPRQIYTLTGGRRGLRWNWLQLRQSLGMPPQHLCLKDPFMSLATPYLVRKHGLRVICMVRHPAAVHYSTKRLHWRFDVENLLRQPELIERYGADIPKAHWDMAREHDAASIAILWKLMLRINTLIAKEDERLLIVKHEAFCMEPMETASRICRHLQISFTAKAEQFVADHSGGDRAEAQDGKEHDFKRNSKAIPSAWKGKLLKKDEKMIIDIAEEEILQVYGCASK